MASLWLPCGLALFRREALQARAAQMDRDKGAFQLSKSTEMADVEHQRALLQAEKRELEKSRIELTRDRYPPMICLVLNIKRP